LPQELLNETEFHVTRKENDVFAFCVLSVQMFAGRCLIWEENIGFVQSALFALLIDVPDELYALFARGLDENPQMRPTMDDFVSELQKFLSCPAEDS
jgi:hypothetical protein